MTVDIVEFLTARLDEDEADAKAATPGPWSYNPGAMWLGPEAFERFDRSKGEEYVAYGGPSPFTGCIAATGEADHPQSMADAAFIARHDPARILREVAAKRRVLARHRPRDLDRSCFGCGFNNQEESMVDDIEDCPDLRDLAAVYADHPDYDPAWRVA